MIIKYYENGNWIQLEHKDQLSINEFIVLIKHKNIRIYHDLVEIPFNVRFDKTPTQIPTQVPTQIPTQVPIPVPTQVPVPTQIQVQIPIQEKSSRWKMWKRFCRKCF